MLSFSRKRAIKNQIQTIVITNPCTAKWENMEGDNSVRFCGDCKLNVHNLSALPDTEVVALLKKKAAGERVCAYFYRNAAGEIVTDNCPKHLKFVRNRLQALAASIAIALTTSLWHSADAQGLVGAPVDPRYGMGGVGFDPNPPADYVGRATIGTGVVSLVFAALRSRRVRGWRLAKDMVIFCALPVFVYFVVLSGVATNLFIAPGPGFNLHF